MISRLCWNSSLLFFLVDVFTTGTDSARDTVYRLQIKGSKGKVNEDSFYLFGHARSEKISFRGLLLQMSTSVRISFTSLYRYC